MSQIPRIKLSDGNVIPLIGLGTSWTVEHDTTGPCFEAVKHSIKSGYRFIDTASIYENEKAIGLAIKQCIEEGCVKREDIYICSKVWSTAHKRESVIKSCKESLERLGVDYIDLYLIHWPMALAEDGDPFRPEEPHNPAKLRYTDTHFTETWQGMEDVKDKGWAKSIGVSNFNHHMLDEVLSMCKHRPTVNQMECHVYLNNEKLHNYCKKEKIILQAYCPLGSPLGCWRPGQPVLLEDPEVKEIAKKYNKSVAQILLKFLVQREIPAIPLSTNPGRIDENIKIFDFVIEQADMDKLMSMNRNLRYCLSTGGYECPDHPLYPFHAEY